jgi:RNA polymerase sigma-70 factor (ECF subfamily)
LEPGADLKTNFANLSDVALIQAFRAEASKNAAFSEIVKRYKVRIYHHVRRILIEHDDADDAAQNAFILVWQNLANFRGDCALFSWIYRIATNEALGILRKRRPNLNLEAAAAEMAQIVDSGNLINGDSIQRELQKAVLLLPEKQRIVFHMKYFDDLTYEQIAEITGTSIGALKASYFHAVKKIEEQIKKII